MNGFEYDTKYGHKKQNMCFIACRQVDVARRLDGKPILCGNIL